MILFLPWAYGTATPKWSAIAFPVNRIELVGPTDNKPSTDELHHFIQFLKNYMWHAPYDTYKEVNILSKFQVTSSFGLEWRCFKDFEENFQWLNYLWMNEWRPLPFFFQILICFISFPQPCNLMLWLAGGPYLSSDWCCWCLFCIVLLPSAT